MLYRLPAFATTVLLAGSLLACSKKEVQPDPVVASYQLNSRQIDCQPKLSYHVDTGYDFLELKLTTTPQPAAGPETLALYFYKPVSAPTTAYELSDMILDDGNQFQKRNLSNPAVTLVQASNGSFSGTFSGETCIGCPFNFQQTYTVRNGTFANVQQ